MSNVKVGDKIRIVDARPTDAFYYKNGDVLYVSNVWEGGHGVDAGGGIELYTAEFEVITGEALVDKTTNLTSLIGEMESVLKRLKKALAND